MGLLKFSVALLYLSGFTLAVAVPRDGVFDTTRTIKSSRTVNATVHAALSAVTDPHTLIMLSPLVTEAQPDASDHSLWHITDMISVLGLKIPIQYTAKFTFLDDGVDSDTNASGVHTTNRWRVGTDDTGGTVITEEADLSTNIFIADFVEEQIKTSHAQLLDAMADLLNAN